MFRGVMYGVELVLLFALGQSALAQEGWLHSVTAPEVKTLTSHLNTALLPPHSSHMVVEAKQVFRLTASGYADLMLVPVTFWHDEDEALSLGRCGLFEVPTDGGQQKFVYTVTGKENEAPATQCGNLLAIRRTPHDGPKPVLKLTYRMFDPPRFEGQIDVQLRWDGEAETYKVEPEAS